MNSTRKKKSNGVKGHSMRLCISQEKGQRLRNRERERKKKASNQLGLRRKVSPQKAWDQYLVWAFCLLGFSLKCSPYILVCLVVLELKTLAESAVFDSEFRFGGVLILDWSSISFQVVMMVV